MIEIVSLLLSLVFEILGWYYIFGEKNYLFGGVCLVSTIVLRLLTKKEDNASLH